MVNISLYKSYRDYPNDSGIYQVLYPVRDSVAIFNPYTIILIGIFIVACVASYYEEKTFTGKSRFFNSMVASSFVTFLISIFFALGELVTPLVPLLFIGITVLSYSLLKFYK